MRTPSSGREVVRSSRVSDRAVRVIGAGSQVGYFLVPYLRRAGWKVIELHRDDLTRSRVAEGGAAICLAPLDVLPPLLPVLRDSGLERVVAFSTTSVLYKLGSGNAAERARILRIAAAEDDMAAYCTREGIAWTLFRPTLVYGCGRDRGIASIAGFVRRFGFFPVAGAASGLRQPVHADDLAHACVRVLDDHNSWAKAYTLSGGEVLTCRRMIEAVFDQLRLPARIVSIPPRLLRTVLAAARLLPGLGHLSPEMADRMQKDLCFDHTPARRELGFRPRAFALDELAVMPR